MTALALILTLVLAVIAALHIFWAFGGIWPASDVRTLARRVVGSPGVDRMPTRGPTLVVAALIAAGALWPLMWVSLIPALLPQTLIWLGMIVLALVFLGRGAAGYLPAFRAKFPEEPFATLDRRYYSPLCMAIGLGFAVLFLSAGA